jgi:hypothetical protein
VRCASVRDSEVVVVRVGALRDESGVVVVRVGILHECDCIRKRSIFLKMA